MISYRLSFYPVPHLLAFTHSPAKCPRRNLEQDSAASSPLPSRLYSVQGFLLHTYGQASLETTWRMLSVLTAPQGPATRFLCSGRITFATWSRVMPGRKYAVESLELNRDGLAGA